jgi:hypothetical protein
VKYCVIRKVPYRIPGKKSRIVWANVIAENNELALLLVPKTHVEGSHSIALAQQNGLEGVFEAISPSTFEIGSTEVKRIGNTLKALRSKLISDETIQAFEKEFGDL